MHRLLAAVLGLAGFLAVAVWWLVQIAHARPHPGLDGILARALLAAAACYLAGRVFGRLAVTLFGEAWAGSHARGKTSPASEAAPPGSGEAAEEGGGEAGPAA